MWEKDEEVVHKGLFNALVCGIAEVVAMYKEGYMRR